MWEHVMLMKTVQSLTWVHLFWLEHCPISEGYKYRIQELSQRIAEQNLIEETWLASPLITSIHQRERRREVMRARIFIIRLQMLRDFLQYVDSISCREQRVKRLSEHVGRQRLKHFDTSLRQPSAPRTRRVPVSSCVYICISIWANFLACSRTKHKTSRYISMSILDKIHRQIYTIRHHQLVCWSIQTQPAYV